VVGSIDCVTVAKTPSFVMRWPTIVAGFSPIASASRPTWIGELGSISTGGGGGGFGPRTLRLPTLPRLPPLRLGRRAFCLNAIAMSSLYL
jgi:hypothetical protein